MEYSRFERQVLAGTAVLVGLSIAVSWAGHLADLAEVVGQLAMIAVMAAAVHAGRRAGTIAALAACLAYLALRLPLISAGLSTQALLLIVSRLVGYCLVGIVGGESFARLKYIIVASKGSDVIDEWSRVYNQQYAARALDQAIQRSERYGEPFSAIVIRLEPTLTDRQDPRKRRGLVRSVASFLRDDVRLVDDVARLDDGRFVVLLPHTPAAAAPIVAKRLADGICAALGIERRAVTTTCLATGDDNAALRTFADGLHVEDEDAD